MTRKFSFDAILWLYPGDAPWVFVTLPVEVAEEIRAIVPPAGGFGSVKVEAGIGGSAWSTSLFPDKESGSFVLPIKRAIREAESLEIGDTVRVTLGPAGGPFID